jgi:hypothetical protein
VSSAAAGLESGQFNQKRNFGLMKFQMMLKKRMSKECILSVFIDSIDRAQRFDPSKFCGLISCCSAVRPCCG